MAFTLKLHGRFLKPAVICDRCDSGVPPSGFYLWNANPESNDAQTHASFHLCGDECLEAFVAEQPESDDWLAIPIDAYLANLVGALGIDIDVVLERERAAWAAEHTRHEAPE